MTEGPDNSVHNREIDFHDAWAAGADINSIKIDEMFEAVTAPEKRFCLQLMGPLKGKKILDVGPALGESSIYFASRGAAVTAVDISPNMVDICVRNGRIKGVDINGVVSSGESLNLPDNHFDIAYAACILHHVADKEKLIANIHKTLRPGGLFIAIDPLKYNPAINVYRRIATQVRTEDEAPMGFDDLAVSRKYFSGIRHREFWFLTLALFVKYFLLDRKDPNKKRYWQAVIEENEKTIGWWFVPLLKMDSLLLRLPLVKALAWYMVQWGYKE